MTNLKAPFYEAGFNGIFASGNCAYRHWRSCHHALGAPHRRHERAQRSLRFTSKTRSAYAYVASIPFFVALYEGFKVLGYAGQNKVFSPASVKALRTIKHCAIAIIGFVVVG
jgi:DUF2975 family protein